MVETRLLGRTGLTVPRVCFGTMTFGSQVDENHAGRIVDFCLDRGLLFLDTANVYNEGESERILGRCLRGKRDKVVLASKAFGAMDGYRGLSRNAIFQAVDASLARLGTDYLDLYYLHQPDYSVPIEESLGALDDLVKAGKIRFPALSNFAAWQVTEARWVAAEKGYLPATVTQPIFNLLARRLEQEFFPMCRHLGIFTCIYNPLAGGLLTGKQPKDQPLPGSRFDNNQQYLDRYWHPAFFEAVQELAQAAHACGRSLVSLALNWTIHHTPADCLILGASRLEQLEQNLAALQDGPLSEETANTCDRVWQKLRGIAPKYNR
jgi:aryl-alcohol dehydrogenase-like predicted oxidoreductase